MAEQLLQNFIYRLDPTKLRPVDNPMHLAGLAPGPYGASVSILEQDAAQKLRDFVADYEIETRRVAGPG